MSFSMTFTVSFLILVIVALIVSACGFYKYVYFISLGYGFSIAAMGVAMIIMFRDALTIGPLICCLLFVVYGCRLGGYLLIREVKSAAYRDKMKTEIKSGKDMKLVAKIAIWTSCSLLYALQVSPVFFRLQNGLQLKNMTSSLQPMDFWHVEWVCAVGAVIMLLGIVLESAADLQKSAAKKKNPKRFCDQGLYRIVRCPNYLGEVLFWSGVLVSGCSTLSGPWQWIAGVFGWACIVYIMFGGARRLELRQNRTYGADPEYQEYVKKVPILLPLIPLYSVADQKWLVG